jgi:hypothetical protein
LLVVFRVLIGSTSCWYRDLAFLLAFGNQFAGAAAGADANVSLSAVFRAELESARREVAGCMRAGYHEATQSCRPLAQFG